MIGSALNRLAHPWQSQWLLLRLCRQSNPGLFALTSVATLIAAVLPTAMVLTFGAVVRAIISALREGESVSSSSSLLLAAGAFGLIFVLQQLLFPLRATVADALARRVQRDVNTRLMRASLGPAAVAHLEDPEVLDQVRRASNTGAVDVRVGTVSLINQMALRLQGAVAIALLATFSWWIAIIVAGTFLFRTHVLGKAQREFVEVIWGRARRLRNADYYRDLAVKPAAAKELRIFGLANWVVARFRATWTAAMDEIWSNRPSYVRITVVASVPVILSTALLMGFLADAALDGAITVAQLATYSAALTVVFRTIGVYSADDTRIERGASGLIPLTQLERTLVEEPRFQLSGERAAEGMPASEVRFEDVRFRYPGQTRDVFQALNLTIPVGKSTAIVGDNGSGKTTLIKLLARLYDPAGGRITVDGHDLRGLQPRGWQRRVSVMFQDYERYALSAHDNIGFGAVERMDDQNALEESARLAGARELIAAMPRDWNTILNRQFSDGIDLSGGEWQRIALARALFATAAGAEILVLDEPTANLDVTAEAAFYDRFLELTRGRTAIVISHRFATVRRADHILVLRDGGISESGTHEELLALGGYYAEMFELQAQRFRDIEPREVGP